MTFLSNSGTGPISGTISAFDDLTVFSTLLGQPNVLMNLTAVQTAPPTLPQCQPVGYGAICTSDQAWTVSARVVPKSCSITGVAWTINGRAATGRAGFVAITQAVGGVTSDTYVGFAVQTVGATDRSYSLKIYTPFGLSVTLEIGAVVTTDSLPPSRVVKQIEIVGRTYETRVDSGHSALFPDSRDYARRLPSFLDKLPGPLSNSPNVRVAGVLGGTFDSDRWTRSLREFASKPDAYRFAAAPVSLAVAVAPTSLSIAKPVAAPAAQAQFAKSLVGAAINSTPAKTLALPAPAVIAAVTPPISTKLFRP